MKTNNNHPVTTVFFSDLKEAFLEKGGTLTYEQSRKACDLWTRLTNKQKRSLVYAVKAGSFFRPSLDQLVYDYTHLEDDDDYVTCERCGERVLYDEAYHGYSGWLCDCCHDDLFG